METKLFQIRDEGTHIPVMATQFLVTMDDREFRRAGFKVGTRYTVVTKLNTMESQYNEDEWTGGRTMRIAHIHIHENFTLYKSGRVIDVEYILGIQMNPKEPE